MSNPTVKCTVDQCTHYMPGDQCMAAKIGVYNDEIAGESTARSDTQCKSFHLNSGIGDMVGGLHNANISGTLKAAFMDGKQITPAVECYVNYCKYWDQGNYCNAREIHIAGPNAAKTPDTNCNTFEAE
ncbi:Hypothetical protein LUCI_3986 [Lucifera butyrica]|uniref:DUF1540 domain-containing protein n=1 Tax=Lucifera butyrica TaxID=1351585 RepID=A0A498RHX8_9FIRM|nr:DUF1540 domain-containing protein [Lucifera butyrica]VBB08708.1 Hypothetical protein LUCI_3986 [Lucifera butyrica]